MVNGPSVRRGDTVQITDFSSFAATLLGHVTALLEDGTYQTIHVPEFVTGTGLGADRQESVSQFRRDGRIIDGVILNTEAGNRGQTYARLEIRRGSSIHGLVASGYVYGGRIVSLGMTEGPRDGGAGFVSWLEIFSGDRAGNAAAVDQALALTNAFRKIYGLAWFYHCSSDVATRTFNTPSLQNLGGAKPSGWTTSGNNGLSWSFGANITLTANEEGMFYVNALEGKDGRAAHVDNGAITVINTASNPTPFPLLVTEDEVGVMRFPAISTGNANDTHRAYLLVEEWVDV